MANHVNGDTNEIENDFSRQLAKKPSGVFFRSRLRRFFSAKQLCECMQPLCFIAYCHGLTRFYITGDGNGNKQVKKSCFGRLNGILHIVTYCICYVLTLQNHRESIAGYFFRSRISYVGDMMQIVSGFIGVTVIYLTAIAPNHRLETSFNIMNKMDGQLRSIGIKILYSKILRFSYIFLFIIFVVNMIYIQGTLTLLTWVGLNPSFALIVTFSMQHSVIAIAITMFNCFTRLVEMRFVMLNKVLKNLGKQWDQNTVKTVPPKQRSLQCLDSFSMYTIVTKNPSEIVQESMDIHQLICEAAATANKYFTYQLLTIISIAFLIIVFDAYYVLETLLGKSKRESKFKTVEFVTFFSCQMILYVLAIISIVEGSNRAIKKSEKTGGIVHGLLNKAKDPEVKEKLKQFSMQLLHLKVNFTAAGLFNIDRTLYFTISGALTTYLIILLQFTSHNMLNSNSEEIRHLSVGYNESNSTMGT